MPIRLLAGTLLGLTLTTTAFAQSYTAPAGIPAVTAPGGVEGRAAVPNLIDARNVGVVGTRADVDGNPLTTGSIHRSYAPRGADRLR